VKAQKPNTKFQEMSEAMEMRAMDVRDFQRKSGWLLQTSRERSSTVARG
jgi:hypothetical protein